MKPTAIIFAAFLAAVSALNGAEENDTNKSAETEAAMSGAIDADATEAKSTAPIEGKITLSSNGKIEASVRGAKKKMSAIVIYSYDGGEIITNRCEVTNAQSDSASLKCASFSAYDQDSTPKLKIAPREGDRVVFAPLFRNAVIIAPDSSRYARARERNANFRLVHPDLFALELMDGGENAPRKEDFQSFCDAYLIGSAIFALKDGDYITDCQTMGVLSFAADGAEAKEAESRPFYHRLEPFGKAFESFDLYYKTLISED